MSILSLTLPRPSVDRTQFREAMAHLASGVALIAWWDAETPRGLLVSSLTALSTEPPRVLFCVAKTAPAHGALLKAEECSLSLLSATDQEEAERLSLHEQAQDAFSTEAWTLDPQAPPRRLGALVSLTGFVDSKMDAGSHSIFVVRVGGADVRKHAPLVYFDRAFHRLAPADA